MSDEKKPLPVLIVKPKSVSRRDINRAEKAGFICIIECTDPEQCRFMNAPPDADIDAQARAALQLMRTVIRAGSNATSYTRGELTHLFAQALMVDKEPDAVKHVRSVKP